MKLFSTSSLFLFLMFAMALAQEDSELKGIQVVLEGEDCKSSRPQGGGVRNPNNADGDQRCARTAFPPDNRYKYLPDITYTFWSCGGGPVDAKAYGSRDGCTCGITRMVTVSPGSNTAVAMEPGEYLSEAACNANCARERDDKCWVCTSSTSPSGYTNYYCKHKADIAPFMLGASGQTKFGCFRSCIRLEMLPYELKGPL